METSELTLLDLQNFFEKLKGHVRSEVEKYVDEKAKEIKDKAATYITNKPKKVRVAENQYTGAQNKEVIKALFIGKILVWDRSNSGQKYEIKVEGVEEFVDNKTGKVIKAKSLSGVCIALVGGGSYSGWEELEVCLNPKEGLQLLKYHRKKFFLDQFSLLVNQIRDIAELFNCGVRKRGNKFAQSALKQSNCIIDLVTQNVLFYIQPKSLNGIELR